MAEEEDPAFFAVFTGFEYRSVVLTEGDAEYLASLSPSASRGKVRKFFGFYDASDIPLLLLVIQTYAGQWITTVIIYRPSTAEWIGAEVCKTCDLSAVDFLSAEFPAPSDDDESVLCFRCERISLPTVKSNATKKQARVAKRLLSLAHGKYGTALYLRAADYLTTTAAAAGARVDKVASSDWSFAER